MKKAMIVLDIIFASILLFVKMSSKEKEIAQEDFQMKSKKVVVGIIAAILVVICMGVAFLATQNDDYYTQIDNRWVQELSLIHI